MEGSVRVLAKTNRPEDVGNRPSRLQQPCEENKAEIESIIQRFSPQNREIERGSRERQTSACPLWAVHSIKILPERLNNTMFGHVKKKV